MFCEVFSLCYVGFLTCVMCCSYAYDTSLRSVRALRARCGPFGPAAGASRPRGLLVLTVTALITRGINMV